MVPVAFIRPDLETYRLSAMPIRRPQSEAVRRPLLHISVYVRQEIAAKALHAAKAAERRPLARRPAKLPLETEEEAGRPICLFSSTLDYCLLSYLVGQLLLF